MSVNEWIFILGWGAVILLIALALMPEVIGAVKDWFKKLNK